MRTQTRGTESGGRPFISVAKLGTRPSSRQEKRLLQTASKAQTAVVFFREHRITVQSFDYFNASGSAMYIIILSVFALTPYSLFSVVPFFWGVGIFTPKAENPLQYKSRCIIVSGL